MERGFAAVCGIPASTLLSRLKLRDITRAQQRKERMKRRFFHKVSAQYYTA